MLMSPDVGESAGRDVGVDGRSRILYRIVHHDNFKVMM
jgi:hypothetical protein